jgi:hypothetical protein
MMMSDSVAVSVKSARVASARSDASDLRMLAQVERWMAAIREINREQLASVPAVN